LDLYRLETPDQITAAGLEEYLTPNGVTVIEWAERWFSANVEGQLSKGTRDNGIRNTKHALLAGPHRLVKIEATNDTTRQITYEDSGG
jgi:tRNA A37 threonylcarbamoyladenosine biosynthesis protein TsaE